MLLMNIQDRLLEVTQKFNTKQVERDNHLKSAEDCLEEMHRLQGEHRAFTALAEEEKEQSANKEPEMQETTSEANVIEAVPAEEN